MIIFFSDSFFYFGTNGTPSGNGILIPDEKGRWVKSWKI